MAETSYTLCMLSCLISTLVVILVAVHKIFKQTIGFWSYRTVPYIASSSVFGNIKDIVLYKGSPAEVLQALYEDEKTRSEPVTGIRIFHKPVLLIRDLELVKRIMVKDLQFFSNRYSSADPHSDSLGNFNLFFLKNPLWKQLRSNLTPIFTSGKIKQLFHLVKHIGKQLDQHLDSLTLSNAKQTVCMEIKELCSLFTTDVIASAAYGIQTNSMKNPDNDFRKNGRAIFQFTPWRAFEFTTFFFMPQLASICKCKVFSKEATEFLRSTFNYIMKEREETNSVRNDLIDLLIGIKKSSKLHIDGKDVEMDGDILVAQAAIFFTAGYETTSSAMSFALYELAKAPDMQTRLREEIRELLIKNKGDVSYETILEMKYLNMVVSEILRLYPPLPFFDRLFEASGNQNGYSLEPHSDFVVPNKMPVYIPVYAIHRDEKYFPEPNKFDPERFAPENKDKIVPYSYIPFGVGGRACIGERFGLMQAKIGLFYFLKNHFVKMSPKTQNPMKFEKKALIIQAEGGIYCDIVRDPLVEC